MSDDDSTTDQPTVRLSPKEFARQQRRAAYVRAKERRASDPKQLAFKEAMKARQREAYQASKEYRKARVQEQKATREEREATRQAAIDRQLLMPAPGRLPN